MHRITRARKSPVAVQCAVLAACIAALGSAAGCHRNEGNLSAAEIARHGEETRELLVNEANRLTRAPRQHAGDETIRALRYGANELSDRSTRLAAAIRDQTPAQGGGPAVSTATRQVIADARCQVAAMCGMVGPGRPYASLAECSDRRAHDGSLGWEANSCGSHGFLTDKLDRCVNAIRAQNCEALDIPDELSACRPTVVCARR